MNGQNYSPQRHAGEHDNEICAESDGHNASDKQKLALYHDAVRLLTRREYCEAEMRQRLAMLGFDSELIDWGIGQLERDGYLSEYRFAESYLRSRLNRGEAPWLAAKKAEQKGARSEAVQAALAELSEGYDSEQAARDLLQARDPGALRFEDERVWQRQARFLRNKGFNADTILRVLKER